MASGLPYLPTLAEFLDAANRQGCTHRVFKGRIVVENHQTGMVVPLPPIREDQQLTQFMTEYLCRLLRVDGFVVDYSKMVDPNRKPTIGEES